MGVDDAGKTGRGLLTQHPEDLKDAVKGMNQAELDMFRRGGMRTVNDAVDNTADNLDAGGRLSSGTHANPRAARCALRRHRPLHQAARCRGGVY